MQSHERKKYIENKIDTSVITDEVFSQIILSFLGEKLAELEEAQPPDSTQALRSSGKKGTDPTMYTGTGGNIYVYYRLHKFSQSQGMETDFLEKALTAYEVNSQIISQQMKSTKRSERHPSFFMGTPGIDTIGAIIYSMAPGEHDKQVKNCVHKVLEYVKIFQEPDLLEYELLYGVAGYLYCLLLLKTNIEGYDKQIDTVVTTTFDELVEAGIQSDHPYLQYTFPKGKHPYLGAAHGTFGVIYLLIRALQLVPALQNKTDFVNLIQKTVDEVTKWQTKSGGFPTMMLKEYFSDHDLLVHFCHGAPGAIPLFLAAHHYFGDQAYLNTALQAGEHVWQQGLLKKSFGLCHGICGNAYFLMSLYRETGDLKWLKRVQGFLMATTKPEVIEEIKNNEYSGFRKIGVPDTPYSLMEGLGGQVVAYADFLAQVGKEHKDMDIRFPGYEI